MGRQWDLPPHLEQLLLALMEVAAGRTKRLLITMPPRHGKSQMTSWIFPAWFLGRFPDKRIIFASYQSEFASMWGGRARDVLTSFGQQVFGVRVSPTVKSSSWWEIDKHKGTMWATGAGGAIVGKGADLFIIDDPYKDDSEANSPTIRDRRWDWYRITVYSRLEPGAAVIIIQTRWHREDIAGKLLDAAADGGEPWKVINFPALAGENDVLGRKEGEALWPARYDRRDLLRIKGVTGPYWFSAVFQQSPAPESGLLFKRPFKYFYADEGFYCLIQPDGTVRKHAEADCWLFATADLASSLSKKADYFVCCVWVVTPDYDLLLLEVKRERLEGPDQLEHLHEINTRYSLRKTAIESVQYQATLCQYGLREGLVCEEIKVHTKKEIRAEGPATRQRQGKVYLRRNASFLADVEKELLEFNKGDHDDIVDNFSIADEVLRSGVSHGGGVKLISTMRKSKRSRFAMIDPRAV